MTRLGIITGLIVEADLIATAARGLPETTHPLIDAVGGRASEAEARARRQAAAGVRGLVSFGIAGGLDPALSPGDIVVADAVRRSDGAVFETDPAWRDTIARKMDSAGRIVIAPIAGADAPVATVAAKATLHASSGAAAVDMESHGVAAASAEFGLPLLVVRAIADPASRAVPAAALAGIAPDGRRKPVAVLLRLTVNPFELPALIRLARYSAAAMDSLSRAVPAILVDTI